jgi:hypothetical protein
VADQLYRVEVRYAKTTGTPKVRLMWQSNSQELQVISTESLFNLQYIDAVPHSFNVKPAESDPSHTLFEQTSGLEDAVVNVEEVHILTVRDAFGNLKQDQVDRITVTLDHTTDRTISVDATVQAIADAKYQVSFTLTKVGSYSMKIYFTDSLMHTAQSGLEVSCRASSADPQFTVLHGDAITNAVAGELHSFTVTLFDEGNNQLSKGGDTLAVSFTPGTAEIEIVDQMNGVYEVKYRIEQSGTYTLDVVTNYATEAKKTSQVIAVHAQESMLTSLISYAEIVDVQSEQTVQVDVFDRFTNKFLRPLDLILSVSQGSAHQIYGTFTNTVENSYEATFTIPEGTESESNCGEYRLAAYSLAQGLEAKYFTN